MRASPIGHLIGVCYLTVVHLIGTSLIDVLLTEVISEACLLYPRVPLTGVHLRGVHLICVPLQ